MIDTARLVLRPWQPSDREPFAQMNADPRVMEFFPAALTVGESNSLVDKIEAHFHRHGFSLWALEERSMGAFLGFAGLAHVPFEAHFTPAVEIGWRLAHSAWNRGFATEAARAAVQHGFTALGLDQIVAFTVPANTRSRHVMDKLGMTHDIAGDFNHPRLAVGHPLRPHLLYRLRRGLEQFRTS